MLILFVFLNWSYFCYLVQAQLQQLLYGQCKALSETKTSQARNAQANILYLYSHLDVIDQAPIKQDLLQVFKDFKANPNLGYEKGISELVRRQLVSFEKGKDDGKTILHDVIDEIFGEVNTTQKDLAIYIKVALIIMMKNAYKEWLNKRH